MTFACPGVDSGQSLAVWPERAQNMHSLLSKWHLHSSMVSLLSFSNFDNKSTFREVEVIVSLPLESLESLKSALHGQGKENAGVDDFLDLCRYGGLIGSLSLMADLALVLPVACIDHLCENSEFGECQGFTDMMLHLGVTSSCSLLKATHGRF